MAAEPAGHTLQSTALVSEAYLRFVGNADARRWDHRGHFFATATEVTREKAANRRGGERGPVELLDVPATRPDERLLALNEAVTRLAAERDFRVIAYRFGNRGP